MDACTHTAKKKGKKKATPEWSDDTMNNSESADVHAATQTQTNPLSDDELTRMYIDRAIGPKPPDRGRGVDRSRTSYGAAAEASWRGGGGELAGELTRRRVWIGNARVLLSSGAARSPRRGNGGGVVGLSRPSAPECRYL